MATADEMERQMTTPTANELAFEHRVRSLVDHELTLRDHKRLRLLLKKACLPVDASIEDVDYRAARGLDKSEFQTLCSLDWIRNHHSLVITGPTGTGQSGRPAGVVLPFHPLAYTDGELDRGQGHCQFQPETGGSQKIRSADSG